MPMTPAHAECLKRMSQKRFERYNKERSSARYKQQPKIGHIPRNPPQAQPSEKANHQSEQQKNTPSLL